MANRQRKIKVEVRLDENEAKLLNIKYAESGYKSRSAFLRHLIIYEFTYDIDYSFMQEYNWHLAKIGNNLNQIAKIANTNNTISNEDLLQAKEIMEQVWQSQEYILSKLLSNVR